MLTNKKKFPQKITIRLKQLNKTKVKRVSFGASITDGGENFWD